jgi:hypothetical protein
MIKGAAAVGGAVWAAPAIMSIGSRAVAGSPQPCSAGKKVTFANGTVGTTCCGPNDCSGTQTPPTGGLPVPNQCYISVDGPSACAANLGGAACGTSSTCPAGSFCSGSVCVHAA